MVDVIARQQAIEQLVARLSDIAPPNWVRVRAAFETHPDGSDVTWAIVGAVNLGDRGGYGQFDNDPVTYDRAMEFLAASDPAWTSCVVTVDRGTDFDVDLGYDGTTPAGQFSPEVADTLNDFPTDFEKTYGAPPHSG